MKYLPTLTVTRVQMVVEILIRLSLAIAMVTAILNQRWMVLFVSTLTLILTFLPAMLEKRINVYLTTEFELVIIVFIYAAIFLGEVHGYYTRFWWWDTVLHTGSGVALGIVGFLIMYVLQYEKRVSASPFLIALLAFCFALAMGAVWEIFEFVMDSFFGLNMQKSGLVDTMWDLIVDSVGALIVSTAGYFYIRGERTPLFERLVKGFVKENPRLFKG